MNKWTSESCSVMFDSLRSYSLYSPWTSPSQNTGVGSLFLLQGIFPTQGWNPGLLHCRQTLYQLTHRGNPHKMYHPSKKKKKNYLSIYLSISPKPQTVVWRESKLLSDLLRKQSKPHLCLLKRSFKQNWLSKKKEWPNNHETQGERK